jgi:SRSO17 transposase
VDKYSAPSPQEKRFAAYMEGLAEAAGHADRAMPLRMYCSGLLLPGERKSVEPMAARLAPDNVRRMHQSLHHVVADVPWSDEAVLARARSYALTALRQRGPVQAWIVDDTGFPKKGTHSVGVVRRYCGQVGKQENCRVAVSLSVNTNQASLGVCRSSVATALNNLAELLRDKGNDAGAEPLFQRALAIREKALVQTTLRRG